MDGFVFQYKFSQIQVSLVITSNSFSITKQAQYFAFKTATQNVSGYIDICIYKTFADFFLTSIYIYVFVCVQKLFCFC